MAMSIRRIGYRRARLLLLVAGIVVLGVIGVVTYARRVETVEVVATLLFVPIFLAALFGKITGGVVAGVLASAIYAALRAPAIEAVGIERFVGLLISRSVAFVAFGGLGGWAVQQLEHSLRKLELYDQIDDHTRLFNARFFVTVTDLEMSRSKRYRTLFSVASLEIPSAALAGLSRRRRGRVLRALGREVQDHVRNVDRAVHARDGEVHRLAVVLPETGREGTSIFTERFAVRIAEFLRGRGANLPESGIATTALTFPEDETALTSLRQEFARVDRADHPEPPSGPILR
jgi:hypothetical protein